MGLRLTADAFVTATKVLFTVTFIFIIASNALHAWVVELKWRLEHRHLRQVLTRGVGGGRVGRETR